MARLGARRGLVRRLRDHCEASDDIWLLQRHAKPRGARWCLAFCLRLCEMASLLPPPPLGPPAPPALRPLLLAFWTALACSITVGNQYRSIGAAKTTGLSTLSRMAYLTSTALSAVQPVVLLGNGLVHFTASARPLAALLMPPLRFHGVFVACSAGMLTILVVKHTMVFLTNKMPLGANLLEFFALLVTLSYDLLILSLCLAAQDKFDDMNQRLAELASERPELRALVLETAARQYEITADQVRALGSLRTLGLPLAFNSLRHRVKLVTDTYFIAKNLVKISQLPAGTIPAQVVGLVSSAQRVLVQSLAGERVQAASRKTSSVLGAVNSSHWPMRERLLVKRLLRLSRRGVAWSMGGLGYLGHGYMLSVFGSTVAYLIVLMQYQDPVEDGTGNVATNAVARSVNASTASNTAPLAQP